MTDQSVIVKLNFKILIQWSNLDGLISATKVRAIADHLSSGAHGDAGRSRSAQRAGANLRLFHIGANAGYGWGRDPFSEFINNAVPPAPPITLSGVNSQGFLGGFQAGANWQTRSVVGGLEIDLSGTGIKGTSSVAGIAVGGTFNSQMQTDKFDLLGSGRARLGYLVSPDILLYGTGGLAWTRLTETATTVNSDGTFVTTTPDWRVGWAAGAGAEMRLWNSNWLGRVEYLHYDFGSSASSIGGFAFNGTLFLSTDTTSRHMTVDTVRAGMDYQFH